MAELYFLSVLNTTLIFRDKDYYAFFITIFTSLNNNVVNYGGNVACCRIKLSIRLPNRAYHSID